MKAIITILFSAFLMVFITQCKREIGIKNTRLTLRIVDEVSMKPIKGTIYVYQYEKSIYGRYWWTVHEICEKKIESEVDIMIDSLGIYRVKFYRLKEKMRFCSYEFDAKEINLNEVYEIQCPN